MRELELFSGTESWSRPFKERGHEVVTVDKDPRFHPDIEADVLDLDDLPYFDAVFASPPCTDFSTLVMGRNWTHAGEPRNKKAARSRAIVLKTIDIIEQVRPRFFIIENPRCRLRTLGLLDRFQRMTVTYCRYGDFRMKPTDLWGGFPPSFVPRPMCHNGHPDHDRAPRGSNGGTMSLDPIEAAKVPYGLALDLCLAMERDLVVGARHGD